MGETDVHLSPVFAQNIPKIPVDSLCVPQTQDQEGGVAKRLRCWTGLPPAGRDYQALYVYFSRCKALLDSNRNSAICI